MTYRPACKIYWLFLYLYIFDYHLILLIASCHWMTNHRTFWFEIDNLIIEIFFKNNFFISLFCIINRRLTILYFDITNLIVDAVRCWLLCVVVRDSWHFDLLILRVIFHAYRNRAICDLSILILLLFIRKFTLFAYDWQSLV